MSDTLLAEKENLKPTSHVIAPATVKSLKSLRGVDAAEAASFPRKLEASGAPVLSAKASIIFVAFYGKLSVDGLPSPYQRRKFEVDSWGLGATGGTSIGVMYTAYDNWDAFFRNVTSYHAQGIADGGGFLQVNWFIANGTPVGQFNGAMAGAGGLEAGGPGKWTG